MKLRALGGLILATVMTTTAFADTISDANAPLAPGKPAGVHEAQIYGSTLLYLALGAAFIGGLVVLADSKSTTATNTNP